QDMFLRMVRALALRPVEFPFTYLATVAADARSRSMRRERKHWRRRVDYLWCGLGEDDLASPAPDRVLSSMCSPDNPERRIRLIEALDRLSAVSRRLVLLWASDVTLRTCERVLSLSRREARARLEDAVAELAELR